MSTLGWFIAACVAVGLLGWMAEHGIKAVLGMLGMLVLALVLFLGGVLGLGVAVVVKLEDNDAKHFAAIACGARPVVRDAANRYVCAR